MRTTAVDQQEFVTYRRTGATYAVIATGADMHGYVPPQDGSDGQWTVVVDLTPEGNFHAIETVEAVPVLLRAYVATNHMTVTAVHQAEYRPTTGWTPSGYETWVHVTVDNNGGTPFSTWVRSDTRGWLSAIPKRAETGRNA
ncbi:hypothetical protein [Mycobacterium intracellulare]|uniref:hypothetical protein n=1 Tax=Mycobacterium intracellulare TaxID=1767 RepID=UPI001EEF1067|nr:hypothetical protein [Mycobacterium intracellulare]MEE3755357.1 hypothetical protein [Mycobacterium intracellulare]